MKARTSFLKRCLALALALVLLATSANLGAMQANAAGNSKTTVQIAKVVVDNYDLSDAEKALLSSGQLAGGTYSYTEPTEDLVTVDTKSKQITAADHEDWTAVQAKIMVNGEAVETIAVVDGKAAYTYGGNTFSVQVVYALDVEVEAAVQDQLLGTAGWLKAGVANVDVLTEKAGSLTALEAAMPQLVDLAKNGYEVFGRVVKVKDEVKNAILSLDNEMKANGGNLDLLVMQDAYDAGKTAALLKNGTAMKAEIEETYANVEWVYAFLTDLQETADMLGNGSIDAEILGLIDTLHAMLKNWLDAADKALAGDWTAAEKGTALVAENADYAKLDSLVAALGATSAPAAKNPLRVAEKSVQKNLNMYNVTVKVALKVVEDKADSAELVVYEEAAPAVLTLSAGAAKADILKAIDDAQIVADALTKWADEGAYVDDCFDAEASELPATLTKDIAYTVTYAPKNYTLDLDYAEAMTVPYGYKYTLPNHADATKAYDYNVNGEKLAQGEVVVIKGDTQILRTSGKSYATADLYTVVADNYGDALTKDILKSGALNDNTVISYRQPDPTDAASILTLLDDTITAKSYDAAYSGLKWAPYTYGAEGTENTFSGNTAPWSGKQVKVTYKLSLDNFGKAKAEEVLALAVTLKAEAAQQKGAMDSLAGLEATLKMLDKAKLGALNGVIDVTDFDADAAENARIKAELKRVVSAIIANNLDSNNLLKICNMVTEYNTDGMSYYYKNYAAIKAEVDSLSGYMSELMDNEAALITMCTAAGFPEYADKISDVETQLNAYNAKLIAPNAAINVNSDNLGKLITALFAEGEIDCEAKGAPYILSVAMTAQDESSVMVQIIIETPNGNATVTTDSMDRGTVFTQAMLNSLKAKVDAEVAKLLGENAKYYALSIEDDNLDALVGTELKDNANATYSYTEKKFTVKIDGEADQIVTLSDLEINLPKHKTPGFRYDYTVDGVEDITTSTYTFTLEQIDKLFVDGVYTITRTETDEAKEKLEANLADWIVKDDKGNITALNAKVDANAGSVMDFAMTLFNAGYSYIGMNGEAFLYMNEEDTLEICLQTLIDAILNDKTFGSQTLINLGTNGKGQLVAAEMQLGNSAEDAVTLPFTLYMNSVPSQMATVANGLNTVKDYMTFTAGNGAMDVNLNMPKPVYAAYLSAMMSLGVADENNLDAFNSEIAYQYLWAYVDAIIENEDITTATYTNTLKKLGVNKDLTGAEDYYQILRKAFTNKNIDVNPDVNGKFDMTVTGKSQKAFNALINMLGLDVSAYDMYLGMIKEYKDPNATLSFSCNAVLVNAEKNVDALLLDLNASSITNKVEYTTNLVNRIKTAKSNTVVILMNDVKGDIVFPGNTILDLNGKTINGNVSANGKLFIIDSNMVTANEGGITGSVKATAILGGTYPNADVTKYLVSGYKQVNGTVQNALYTVEGTETAYNYVINTDFLAEDISYTTFAPALAVDMTVDIILNYYNAVAMSVDGNELYNINFEDLITLITSGDKVEAVIDKVLACIGVPGIGETAELFLEDLLNFAAIEEGLKNGEPVAKHTITTKPFAVKINHITDGNYMDIGFGASEDKAVWKTVDVGIAFTGENKYIKAFQKLVGELAKIVTTDVDITLTQPVYNHKNIEATGSFKAVAKVDMATEDYRTIVGVVLAYGNPAKRADVAKAINTADQNLLKAVVDNTSVAEIFTAMKKMSRNVNFKAMADAVGVTIDVSDAAAIESAYHTLLCANGKVLEELDITGMNSKLGALYNEKTGWYELGKADMFADGEISARGFSAYAAVTLEEISLSVKLFGDDDCLWGDVNHDGLVNTFDAAYVLQYYVGNKLDFDFCEKRADVDQVGGINTFDAAYILQYFVGSIKELPV